MAEIAGLYRLFNAKKVAFSAVFSKTIISL
jgi:hypothetical protein